MQIKGFWLDDVRTERGLSNFIYIYDRDPEKIMVDYETTRQTWINQNDFKYIVFLEYDGTINHQFTLDESTDSVCVHAQEGLEECGVFNTDGIAFMYVYSDGEEQSLYFIDNSPYDLSAHDIEELAMQEDFTIEWLLTSVGEDATLKNTKFVAQL